MQQDSDASHLLQPPAWVGDLFACIDRRDAAGFADFLTKDGVFRFGSASPVVGRAAIAESVGQFFAAIGGLRHRITLTVNLPSQFICRGEATYTRLDGSEITLPFANIFEMDGDRISDYQIYSDVGPLWNPPE